MLEDLRTCWREGHRVALKLNAEGWERPRTVSGVVDRVAVSGAYVTVRGLHVPVELIEEYVVLADATED
jgi:hypothetical protein